MTLRENTNIAKQYANRLVTGPTSEPVSVAEMKRHLRITVPDFDEYISQSITESREEIEQATGMALLNQTWKFTSDNWQSFRNPWWDGAVIGHADTLLGAGRQGYITLPRYPLSSVSSINTYDKSGAATSITPADYFVIDSESYPGRLVLKSGTSWPIALREANAVEIIYIAGYGATAGSVPSPIRRAIRNMAAWMYSHRGDICGAGDAYTKSGARAIMSRFKVTRL